MSGSPSSPLLETLAAGGVEAVAPERLSDVAAEANALAAATGDARYPVIAQLLFDMLDWWEELGGVPVAIAQELSQAITTQLPAVLSEPAPADGYSVATALANDIHALMTSPNDWIARGLLVEPPESDPDAGH